MRRLVSCLTVISLTLGAASAPADPKPPQDPMHIVDGVLNEIHLKVPALAGGVPVVIRRFGTEGVDLGTGGEDAKNEKRSQATATMKTIAPDLLVEAFRETLRASGSFGELLPADAASIPADALVIEGRFTKIDPGSKAKRYWASFGAGKSGVQATGTVKNAGGDLPHFLRMVNRDRQSGQLHIESAPPERHQS